MYQDDAWGRLIEVRNKGNLVWQKFLKSGLPLAKECATGYEAGPVVKHFTYDGVGRLIRTSSPMVAPDGYQFSFFDAANSEYFATTATRSERFFYDGVRRIQDFVTEPVMKNGEGDTVALADEVYQANNTMFTGPYVRAQYVWGPGDNGVDELLCQLDPRDTSQSSYGNGGGKPWYVMTDAQGDVVSVAHVPPGTNQAAEVGGQWTYSPYGEVLTYEKLHPHPVVVFGHKTLAIDRLDGQAVNWDFEEGSVSENRRLVPGARNLAYARNRTLDISRGRWLQQDPNASGLTAIAKSSLFGSTYEVPIAIVALPDRLHDAASLYSYLTHTPLSQEDPLGLFILPELLISGLDSLDSASDALEGAASNLRMMFGIHSMTTGYSSRQMGDADWASDWSLPDDSYSRFQSDFGFSAETSTATADFSVAGIRSGKMTRLPEGFHSGPKLTTVYVAYRKKKAVYTGITTNRTRRQAAHNSNNRNFTIEPLKGQFTELQAKAIETRIIQKHPAFENKILSISPKNGWIDAAMSRADKHMPKIK